MGPNWNMILKTPKPMLSVDVRYVLSLFQYYFKMKMKHELVSNLLTFAYQGDLDLHWNDRNTLNYIKQWRIQDSNSIGKGTNLLFGQILTQNCMDIKEIEPRAPDRVLPAPGLTLTFSHSFSGTSSNS